MDSYSVEKSLMIFFTEILIGDFSKKPFKKKRLLVKTLSIAVLLVSLYPHKMMIICSYIDILFRILAMNTRISW